MRIEKMRNHIVGDHHLVDLARHELELVAARVARTRQQDCGRPGLQKTIVSGDSDGESSRSMISQRSSRLLPASYIRGFRASMLHDPSHPIMKSASTRSVPPSAWRRPICTLSGNSSKPSALHWNRVSTCG